MKDKQPVGTRTLSPWTEVVDMAWLTQLPGFFLTGWLAIIVSLNKLVIPPLSVHTLLVVCPKMRAIMSTKRGRLREGVKFSALVCFHVAMVSYGTPHTVITTVLLICSLFWPWALVSISHTKYQLLLYAYTYSFIYVHHTAISHICLYSAMIIHASDHQYGKILCRSTLLKPAWISCSHHDAIGCS